MNHIYIFQKYGCVCMCVCVCVGGGGVIRDV